VRALVPNSEAELAGQVVAREGPVIASSPEEWTTRVARVEGIAGRA
jgi:hypothetical protein